MDRRRRSRMGPACGAGPCRLCASTTSGVRGGSGSFGSTTSEDSRLRGTEGPPSQQRIQGRSSVNSRQTKNADGKVLSARAHSASTPPHHAARSTCPVRRASLSSGRSPRGVASTDSAAQVTANRRSGLDRCTKFSKPDPRGRASSFPVLSSDLFTLLAFRAALAGSYSPRAVKRPSSKSTSCLLYTSPSPRD